MNKFKKATLLVAIGLTPVSQAADSLRSESMGLGRGALIGGLIGGPVGAIVGAAGGAWFGHREDTQQADRQRFAAQLAVRDQQLAELQEAFARAQQGAEEHLRQVKLERDRSAAEQLGSSLWLELHFATGEFALDARVIPQLERLAILLEQHPALQVYLEGHADPRGDRHYNQRLSEARANTVKLHLIRAGLDPERVHTTGYGESRVGAAQGAERWVYDRRVTLRVGFAKQT
jgi:sortase system peptidoglycan-associated protein